MKKILPLLLLAFVLCGLLASCKKNKGKPPELPPAESLKIDFTNFESGKKSDDILLLKGIEDNCWEFSAMVAGYFRSLIIKILAVPVASYELALNQKAILLEENLWQWSYDVKILNYTYKARLTGLIKPTDVLWEMYIALDGTGGFPEFLWFDGTSKIDGTGGQWNLKHSVKFKEPFLRIDWTRSGETMGTVKYTYVRSLNDIRVEDPFKTSFIEYGKRTGPYDAYYTIHYYNNSVFSDVFVEWNITGHNGRVKCSDFFPDSDWHCWDINHANVKCQ
jgi:hypothetical protein